MALVSEVTLGEQKKHPDIQLASLHYRGPTVSSARKDLRHIIADIKGHPQQVWYYSGIHGIDSEQLGQTIGKDPVYDQYRLIKNLEIRVTQPLTPTENQDTRQWDAVGTATLYTGLTPKNGDMIRMDIGNGREGIALVRRNTAKSIFENTVYEIEYIILDYTTPVPTDRLADLENKVVGEPYWFVKELFYSQQNPLIVETEYLAYAKLVEGIHSLSQTWVRSFINTALNTLIIPNQGSLIYDPFLMSFAGIVLSLVEARTMVKVRYVDVSDLEPMKATTIFDLMLNREKDWLEFCTTKMGMVSAYSFNRRPTFNGVFYSGIENVVYPLGDHYFINTALYTGDKTPTSNLALIDKAGLPEKVKEILKDLSFKNVLVSGQSLIPDIDMLSTYILTPAFYKHEGQLTLFETMVKNHIEKKPNSSTGLLALAKTAPYWSLMQRLYLIPMLILMMYQRTLEY